VNSYGEMTKLAHTQGLNKTIADQQAIIWQIHQLHLPRDRSTTTRSTFEAPGCNLHHDITKRDTKTRPYVFV